MSTLRAIFTERWNKQGAALAKMHIAKRALDHVIDAHEDISRFSAAVAANDKLTPVGQRAEMSKYVMEEAAPRLRYARKVVAGMRAKIDEQRGKLVVPKPDPTNIADAIMRWEMRTRLRDMTQGARSDVLLKGNPDPRTWQAVAEAPEFLSGVGGTLRNHMFEVAIEKLHPGALARIQQVADAIEVVDAATQVAFDAATRAVDLPPRTSLDSAMETALGDKAWRIDAQVKGDLHDFAEA